MPGSLFKRSSNRPDAQSQQSAHDEDIKNGVNMDYSDEYETGAIGEHESGTTESLDDPFADEVLGAKPAPVYVSPPKRLIPPIPVPAPYAQPSLAIPRPAAQPGRPRKNPTTDDTRISLTTKIDRDLHARLKIHHFKTHISIAQLIEQWIDANCKPLD